MISDINTELHQALGRVEGKLDIVISNQSSLSEKVSKLAEGQAKHGERISVLESRNTSLRSILALAVAVIAAVATLWGNVIKGSFHL